MRWIELTENQKISVDDVSDSVRADIIDFLLTNAPEFKKYWLDTHGVMSFDEAYVAQFVFGYELGSNSTQGFGNDALKITKLTLDPNEIVGKDYSPTVANKYAGLNTDPPPILVYRDGNQWKCAEGGHRHAAARITGIKSISAFDITHLATATAADWESWDDGQPLTEEARLPLRSGEIDKARGSYGAFIITMHPLDFLKLTTTSDENIAQIQNRSFPDTEEEYYDPTLKNFGKFEMPFLNVSFPSGKVHGHEGRHRSAMVLKQGGTKVPVIIYPRTEDAWSGEATYYDDVGRKTYETKSGYPSRAEAEAAVIAELKQKGIDQEDIYRIKTPYVGGTTLKGEPTRSDGWDKAAWKREDFPKQLIGQDFSDTKSNVRVTNFQVGLVKGYRHFKR